MKLVKTILIMLLSFLLINCTSTKKYNLQINKKHTALQLQEDVVYSYKKLQQLHPNLYQYISKDSLDLYFNNFKNSLHKPMNSLEFYNEFSPIITKIRQGHTYIYPAHNRQTKQEIKIKGKRKNPFRLIQFKTLNNQIFVKNYYGKDSSFIKGSQLLRIDNKDVKSLIKMSLKSKTSDGYNKTLMQEYPYKYIERFYHSAFKRKDSIELTLKLKDSVYKAYLYAYTKKNKIKKDSLLKKLTKSERKIKRKEKKARSKWEYTHGYNKITKENTLNLEFIKTKDSSKSIAYMKIRSFSKGDYETFFEESFTKIDSAKIGYLIIDLRDNLGGRLDEIIDLYSYLTKEDSYQFTSPAKMTKANSFSYPFFHKKTFFGKIAIPIMYPILKGVQLFKVRKINEEPHFVFKSSKQQKPKEKHRFIGKVYVLINGTSFSASSIISNKLQATKRAYLVGIETGGAYNSTVAGVFANIELPNTKNVLRVGLMVLETPHKQTPDGYGVKPDKQIKVTTFEKDEQLDWIIKQVEETK